MTSMKKLILFCLLGVMTASAIAEAAPVDPRREKQLRKECTVRLKQVQKSGWTVSGTIEDHFNRLISRGEDAMEVYGTAVRARNAEAGAAMAADNAAASYARQQVSDLRGRFTNEHRNESTSSLDSFFQAYEKAVEKEIKGQMEQGYTLSRTNPDGTCDIEIYYIISDSAASEARQRALKSALAGNEPARRYEESLSGYAAEGFRN